MIEIPSVFARGGTSKGLFFRATDLPDEPVRRDALLCRAIGSPDPFGMQLDGMGGGISSLSKIVFVAPSATAGVDLDYTFGQVAVDDDRVDYSANCGNLTSAVAPYALYEGLLEAPARGDEAVVTLQNLNVGTRVTARLHVANGRYEPHAAPLTSIPGVAGQGSAIDLTFVDASDRPVSPSGRSLDRIVVGGDPIDVSIVFASAPVIFVRAHDLGVETIRPASELDSARALLDRLDAIRRHAAVSAGLAHGIEAVPLASPKIAMVFAPHDFVSSEGVPVDAGAYDVGIQMVSMERPHRSITLTGALCTAAAASLDGTCVAALSRSSGSLVRIGQPAGVLEAGASVADGFVESVRVVRTARLLMAGRVLV